MAAPHILSARLACADYRREGLLTACAVLGLAAVLAPLLILYGVKFGVVETLTARLIHNPATLEVAPAGSGRYSAAYVASLGENPDVGFALPRTRAIAATVALSRPAAPGAIPPRAVMASMEPTAAGDPLLERYGAAIPQASYENTEGQKRLTGSGVCLSATAAEKLGVTPGDTLTGIVERGRRGAVEKARVQLTVASVLPLAAGQKDVAFLPLALLEAAEDFRDGRAAFAMNPADGWTGTPRPNAPRVYAGFRLYARTLEGVPRLRDAFQARQIEVYTHAEDIEQVMTLSASLGLIFSLISVAAAVGFAASTTSAALAGVKRKERVLGLLRLMGFPMTALLIFPLTQALLTALGGTALASLLYLAASRAINLLIAGSLGRMETLCHLLPQHFAVALGMATALSLAAALGPALRAARTEPSEVIRDV